MEGQDADGNRGMWMTSIDEDYAENILILTWESNADGTKEITTPIAALTSLQALEVQRLIDEHLEQVAPAELEDEGPDPDDARDAQLDREADDNDEP